MARAARLIEVLIGLFFVVTAGMKAVNVEAFAVLISTYGVIKDPDQLIAMAYGVIGLETLVGVFLLAGVRLGGVVYMGAVLLTVVFSGLVVYAWRWKGIEDCGCFGEFVQMGPKETLIKNGILLALLLFAWAGTFNLRHGQDGYRSHWGLRFAGAFLSLAAVSGLLYADYVDLFRESGDEPVAAQEQAPVARVDSDRPFARFVFTHDGDRYNLGEGMYLVAFLSASSEECRNAVSGLNEYSWQGALPPLVALMQTSSRVELEDFRDVTEPLFPTQPIKDVDFHEFIEDAPPALYYVVDGKQEGTWSWEASPPRPQTLLDAIQGPRAAPPIDSDSTAHP